MLRVGAGLAEGLSLAVTLPATLWDVSPKALAHCGEQMLQDGFIVLLEVPWHVGLSGEPADTRQPPIWPTRAQQRLRISVPLGVFAQWDSPGVPLGLLLTPGGIREKQLPLAQHPSRDKAAPCPHVLLL